MSTILRSIRPVISDSKSMPLVGKALTSEEEKQAIENAQKVGWKMENVLPPAYQPFNALVLVGPTNAPFVAKVEDIPLARKYNQNHDDHGRFASGDGGSGSTSSNPMDNMGWRNGRGTPGSQQTRLPSGDVPSQPPPTGTSTIDALASHIKGKIEEHTQAGEAVDNARYSEGRPTSDQTRVEQTAYHRGAVNAYEDSLNKLYGSRAKDAVSEVRDWSNSQADAHTSAAESLHQVSANLSGAASRAGITGMTASIDASEHQGMADAHRHVAEVASGLVGSKGQPLIPGLKP